jgi:hypothetical protein
MIFADDGVDEFMIVFLLRKYFSIQHLAKIADGFSIAVFINDVIPAILGLLVPFHHCFPTTWKVFSRLHLCLRPF